MTTVCPRDGKMAAVSETNRWAAPNLTDMASIARSGADWILGIAERTVGLMRWVVILSVALGVTAFALGVAAADERYRIGGRDR